jgi:hypothetical protein
MAFLASIQKSLDRLSEKQPTTEPMMVISALSGLSQADLMLIQEYLCLRETGLDQDTAYSFMDGRHKQAQKAMSRLQEEVLKQEQALRDQKDANRPAKASRYKKSRSEGIQAYLKDLGYLKPDEIRADTTPPSDVGDLR